MVSSRNGERRPCPDCGAAGPDPAAAALAHLVIHDCDAEEWLLLRLNLPLPRGPK